MSAHVATVFQLKKEVHPNADNLSIVNIPGTAFTVCVRSNDWSDGTNVAFVEPDTLVADTQENAWLCDCKLEEGHHACARHRRIRARKFRGVWSQGLLVPVPPEAVEGDNVWEALGLERYEPPAPNHGLGESEAVQGPPGVDVVYDVENWYRYPKMFIDSERLVATEKIHGANARFTFRDGQMYVGSRRRWLREGDNVWYKVLNDPAFKGIRNFCEAHPDWTLYGEVFGTQDLKYGLKGGVVGFVAFDMMMPNGRFVPYHTFIAQADEHGVPTAPQVWVGDYYGPGTDKWLLDLSNGQSMLCQSQIREGIVVRPFWEERWSKECGRVQLKLVSNQYLERAK